MDALLTVVFTAAALWTAHLAVVRASPPLGEGRLLGMVLLVVTILAMHWAYNERSTSPSTGEPAATPHASHREDLLSGRDPSNGLRLRLGWQVARIALLLPLANVPRGADGPHVTPSDLTPLHGVVVASEVVSSVRGFPTAVVTLKGTANSFGDTVTAGISPVPARWLQDSYQSRPRLRVGDTVDARLLEDSRKWPTGLLDRAATYELIHGADTIVRLDQRIWRQQHMRVVSSGLDFVMGGILAGGLLVFTAWRQLAPRARSDVHTS